MRVVKREFTRKNLDTLKRHCRLKHEVHHSFEDDRCAKCLTQHGSHKSWPDSFRRIIVDCCESLEECHWGDWVTWNFRSGGYQIGAGFVLKVTWHDTDFYLVHNALCKEIWSARYSLDCLSCNLTLLFVLTSCEDVQNEMLNIEARYQKTWQETQNFQRQNASLRVVADKIVLNAF